MPRPDRTADPDPAVPAARLTGVGFGYAEGPEVFRGVNLTLPAGSFHFLTGAGGAGKSTLLALLAGALSPLEGQVELFGADPLDLPRRERARLRRQIGYAPQAPALLGHLSLFDNATLPLHIDRAKLAERRADVAELLAWLGLGRPERPAASLGPGEAQRLGLAMAVLTRPALVLADEPTAHQDGGWGDRILRLLKSLAKTGAAVVVATRDEALAAGSPALRLRDGRIELKRRERAS